MTSFAVSQGEGVGERISLMPGDLTPDRTLAINVDDVAFFGVESLLVPILPVGTQYDHYGITRIDCPTWQATLVAMQRAVVELNQAIGQGDVAAFIDSAEWLNRHQELADALKHQGWDSVRGFAAMLSELATRTSRWKTRYPALLIHGV